MDIYDSACIHLYEFGCEMFVLAIIVCVHEFGHFCLLKKYTGINKSAFTIDKKLKWAAVKNEKYYLLTPVRWIKVSLGGILSGFLPLGIAFLLGMNLSQIIMLSLLYFFLGCLSDIKKIFLMLRIIKVYGNAKIYRIQYFEKNQTGA